MNKALKLIIIKKDITGVSLKIAPKIQIVIVKIANLNKKSSPDSH